LPARRCAASASEVPSSKVLRAARKRPAARCRPCQARDRAAGMIQAVPRSNERLCAPYREFPVRT
jgi:hypothetical protein